jgi:hypothetical protein
MLDTGVCAVLTQNYQVELVTVKDGLARVQVVLDDTEYEFWVLEDALQ